MTLFVSYTKSDDAVVRTIRADLEQLGHHVWMDHQIHGGESWWREIIQEIQGAAVFVFALSKHSWKSRPCRLELDYANALGLPVLPLQVGPLDHMYIPLAERQIIDCRERTADSMVKLVTALTEMVSRRVVLPDPLPAPPPVPFEYLYRIAGVMGPERITPERQEELIGTLRRKLREEDDHLARADIVKLLRELKERNEITVPNAREVDEILAGVTTAPTPADGATRLPPADHWRRAEASSGGAGKSASVERPASEQGPGGASTTGAAPGSAGTVPGQGSGVGAGSGQGAGAGSAGYASEQGAGVGSAGYASGQGSGGAAGSAPGQGSGRGVGSAESAAGQAAGAAPGQGSGGGVGSAGSAAGRAAGAAAGQGRGGAAGSVGSAPGQGSGGAVGSAGRASGQGALAGSAGQGSGGGAGPVGSASGQGSVSGGMPVAGDTSGSGTGTAWGAGESAGAAGESAGSTTGAGPVPGSGGGAAPGMHAGSPSWLESMTARNPEPEAGAGSAAGWPDVGHGPAAGHETATRPVARESRTGAGPAAAGPAGGGTAGAGSPGVGPAGVGPAGGGSAGGSTGAGSTGAGPAGVGSAGEGGAPAWLVDLVRADPSVRESVKPRPSSEGGGPAGEGWWTQPLPVTGDNPGLPGQEQSFASPPVEAERKPRFGPLGAGLGVVGIVFFVVAVVGGGEAGIPLLGIVALLVGVLGLSVGLVAIARQEPGARAAAVVAAAGLAGAILYAALTWS